MLPSSSLVLWKGSQELENTLRRSYQHPAGDANINWKEGFWAVDTKMQLFDKVDAKL